MTALTDPGIVAAVAREFLNTDTPTDTQLATIRTRLAKVEQIVARTAYDDVATAVQLLATRLAELAVATDAAPRRAAAQQAITALERAFRQLAVVRDRLTDIIRRIDDGTP